MDEKELYSVTVDGKQIYTLGNGFHWDDDRLEDWQDLPDDDIETLLQSAKEEGFIKDYDIEEA